MDRAEVLQQIQPIMELQPRRIDHGTRTVINVTPDMVTLRPGGGARILEMTKDGVKSMASFVDLPEKIAKRLSPTTFGRVTTELLERKERYNVLTKDDAIVQFAECTPYGQLPAERVLRTAEKTVRGLDFHRVFVQPDHSATVQMLGPREAAVARGDLVRGGALMTFSPIGTVRPQVQSFVLRLDCTNGATSTIVIREFGFGAGGGGEGGGGGGGEGDDVYQWFRNSIREAYNSLNRVVGDWRHMVEEAISPEDRAMMLDHILKKAGIIGEHANAVRAEALRRPPNNTYDVMNLVTWAGSHLLTEPRQITRALTTAAQYSDRTTHGRTCPTCHRDR